MTNTAMARFTLVLKKEDIERIKVRDNEVTVDLHGLGTKDSLVLLNNIINLNNDSCSIKVIHGYNHGTSLKEMINQRFKNPRIANRTISANNPGLTVIECMAAH